MNGAWVGGIGIIALSVIGVASIIALVVVIRRKKQATERDILSKYGRSSIVLAETLANCFGQQSKGYAQIRGNGYLAVTKQELVFRMWWPQKDLVIPCRMITQVTTAQSFLGKRRNGRLLLVITFRDGAGQIDSAAWLVRNVKDWQQQLNLILRQK